MRKCSRCQVAQESANTIAIGSRSQDQVPVPVLLHSFGIARQSGVVTPWKLNDVGVRDMPIKVAGTLSLGMRNL